jgi:hypothetical protein
MAKTILIAAFLIAMVYILVNRERIYLRDPIATVYRNGEEQSGVQVYMNYSDNILLEQDSGPNPYRILLQDWNPAPGTPFDLRRIRWMACMTTTERAPTMPLLFTGKGKYNPNLNMTDRESSFTDPAGARIRITLR